MQNLILENVSPQFMEIITPRLEDLQKDGKLEYVSILADGIIDLCIVIEDHYFLCMVVLFWATVCEAQGHEEILKSILKF